MKHISICIFLLVNVVSVRAQRPNDQVLMFSDNVRKTAVPPGYGESHFLHPHTDITYTIYFQNTGPDTVFNLKVKDVISDLLDFNSLRVENSSHEFNVSFSGDNVVQFNFPGIRLPNSASNEVASKGFVSFTISQMPSVPLSSVIYNTAEVFFDFNGPFLTNTTYHTVDENFIPSSTQHTLLPDIQLTIAPNPVQNTAQFQLTKETFHRGKLALYDPNGKVCRQTDFHSHAFILERGGLPAGTYHYLIFLDGIPAASGSLIFQ